MNSNNSGGLLRSKQLPPRFRSAIFHLDCRERPGGPSAKAVLIIIWVNALRNVLASSRRSLEPYIAHCLALHRFLNAYKTSLIDRGWRFVTGYSFF